MNNHHAPRPQTRSALLLVAGLAALLSACSLSTPEPITEARTDEPADAEVAAETFADTTPAPATLAVADASREASRALLLSEVSVKGSRIQAEPIGHSPSRPMVDRENYAAFDDNPVLRAAEHPVSTFSIDVDTGSYANVRRMLREGRLPPSAAVRVEELINYFDYDYPAPTDGRPFGVTVEQAVTPWNPSTRLLQIGLQGERADPEAIPAANLVFLVDVSGSMNSPDKLPLLVSALKMLVGRLDADDRVAIVVYAGAAGVVLESTPGDRRAEIVAALERLSAGGSTHGSAGIDLAYAQARQGFIEGGINRVLLATDGDFNVGTVDFDALIDRVERQRASGIELTTLGFGGGNYNDHLMERLADAGNGNHAYIDTLSEARKVLVDEMSSTLFTIARDVKIQIEFNPAVVAEYRLIGYENRLLEREDFNNDRVDAGDIGAGHTVTALYEIALVDGDGTHIDPLRYGAGTNAATDARETLDHADELGLLKLRYKRPGEERSRKIEQVVGLETQPIGERLGFAAAVAAFGQHLRGGQYLDGYDLDRIHALAAASKGADPYGYRGEFLQLLRLAEGFELAQR